MYIDAVIIRQMLSFRHLCTFKVLVRSLESMLSSSSRSVFLRKSIAVRYLLLSSTIIIILWTFHTLLSSSHSPPRPVKPAPHKKDDLTHVLPKRPPRPKAWSDAAEGVKQAFLHAYHGYEDYAAPFDELLPMSRKGSNR